MAAKKKDEETETTESESSEEQAERRRGRETIEVDLGGGDDDDEDEGGAEEEPTSPESPQARPSRREKRASRFKEANERAERAEREATEARERAQRAEQMAYQAAMARGPQPGQEPKDPDDARLAELNREQQLLIDYANTAQNIQPARMRELQERAQAILDERQAISTRRELRKMQGSVDPTMQRQQQALQQLQMRYPEVTGDQRAFQGFIGSYQLALAKGQPDSWETVDRVMKQVAGDFGKGARQPDPALRTRLTGMSKGGSGGSGERRPTFQMTPELQDLADAAFPHIKDQKKRYEHYARRMAARQAKQGG